MSPIESIAAQEATELIDKWCRIASHIKGTEGRPDPLADLMQAIARELLNRFPTQKLPPHPLYRVTGNGHAAEADDPRLLIEGLPHGPGSYRIWKWAEGSHSWLVVDRLTR